MLTETDDINYIWHPFTQMKTATKPIHIASGKGAILYDINGNPYIDAISSWWVNIHGHANEYIANKIAEQARILEHVVFAGFTHSPAQTLAKSIIENLPSHFSKVFFSDNGSTAVEVGIKMAIQFWYNQGIKNKTQIIAFENAYHGDTFGAMSVGERNVFNKPFEQHLFTVTHIPLPNKENVNKIKKQINDIASSGTVAAFIFEPLIQGAAGMLMYEATYLDELISIANENNIICIADEVMTGFGRTGKLFAINHLNQKPDIICLSKGITGGFMPLGLTVCSNKIYEPFFSDEKEKTFFHGHSYTANPLACSAANASMDLLVEESCQNQIKSITSSHLEYSDLLRFSNIVSNIRQQGTILAFDIKSFDSTSYFNSIGKDAYAYFISKGVLLRPLGNVVYIMPPYCISQQELKKVYSVITQFLAYIGKNYESQDKEIYQ
jgi:adenosylmethionine-8-amino-7-oxononanoate aminotransferase